ncbi:hypothetical protein CRENBAI_019704 [Crenichthys baileyi]|uniref:Uncharacterized protein n=1 Tax=Crenichthys baileyi TaxID=28760 RepID=A0AAV9QT80_9TELE
MENSSKKSNKVLKVLIGVLAVWSIISIIIIVVWATSPDLKGSAQCRAELRDMTKKLEEAKVEFNKDKMALEEHVLEAREDQDRLKGKILLLVGHLNTTNTTLEECRQKNVVLAENVTALQEDIRLLQQKEANLTEKLSLQEERIEALQVNLTEAVHQNKSWFSLKEAAESQRLAAQSQTKACEARKQLLEKQMLLSPITSQHCYRSPRWYSCNDATRLCRSASDNLSSMRRRVELTGSPTVQEEAEPGPT